MSKLVQATGQGQAGAFDHEVYSGGFCLSSATKVGPDPKYLLSLTKEIAHLPGSPIVNLRAIQKRHHDLSFVQGF